MAHLAFPQWQPSSALQASTAQQPSRTSQLLNRSQLPDTPEQFVEQIFPLLQSAAQQLGVDPKVLMAQTALETGWGQKITAIGERSSLNLFNIKADK